MVGITHFFFVGAFLFAAGAFLIARRVAFTAALGGVPLLLGGAVLDLVASNRFSASSHDQLAGQEFAIVVALIALAFVGVGVAIARLETPR